MALVETIEDLQLRLLRSIKIFDDALLQDVQSKNRCLACSSRYGICVILGSANRIYSVLAEDIHQTGQAEGDFKVRTIQYHNQQAIILAVAVNSTGSALSLTLQTSNGPFVDIYDILCLDPGSDKQPFPCASIRVSSLNTAFITELEWNPVEPDMFAVITTDETVSTVRCSAIQSDGSVVNKNSASFSSLHIPDAFCLSWSPKGKQLVVGSKNGRVLQLKPELTGPAVRQIEPPTDIPTFENQQLACTGICWLSTTEWLVSFQPMTMDQQPPQPPNISLLVVKKQQPPKWTHFGDVLPTAHHGRVTFCPLLDWRMVFLYASDCTQIVLFGQKGEQWKRFEFETYDIEMPLASDGRSATFPIGAAFDFTSTMPLILNERSQQIKLPPAPLFHLLNTEGSLLPYAIASMSGFSQHRPELNRKPDPILSANAVFGQPPPGWMPLPQITQTQEASKKPLIPQQPQQMFQPTQTPLMPLPNVPITESPTKTTENEADAATARQLEERLRQENAIKMQQQKEREERERQQKEEAEREKQKLELESNQNSLMSTIEEYTKMRNEQSKILEQKICPIRCEIERNVRSTDLENLERLSAIRNELLNGLRRTSQLLFDLGDGTKASAESVNQLRLSHLELEKDKNRNKFGENSVEGKRPLFSSFDIEKRLEFIEKHYDETMCDFERAKKDVDGLGEKLKWARSGGSLSLMKSAASTSHGNECKEGGDVLTPLEQHKLIRTNDNISKTCAKLSSRLHNIQTQLDHLEAQKRREEPAKGPPTNSQKSKMKLPPPSLFQSGRSDDVASFCALQIQHLNIAEDKSSSTDFMPKKICCSQADFQKNVYNYLSNHLQYKIPIATVRQVKPPTLPATLHHQPISQQKFREASSKFRSPKTPETDVEERLANAISDNTFPVIPSKPEMVSIGVQSPDFLMKTPKKGSAKPTPTKLQETPKAAMLMPFSQPPPISLSTQPTFSFKQKATEEVNKTTTPGQSIISGTSTIGLAKPVGQSATSSGATFPFTTAPSSSISATATRVTFTEPARGSATFIVPSSSSPTQLPATNTAAELEAEKVQAEKKQKPRETTTTFTAKSQVDTTIGENLKAKQTTTTTAISPDSAGGGGGEEGMEDEIVAMGPAGSVSATSLPAEQSSISSVNFNFMGGIGLGATSTPVAANRNPFGSISSSSAAAAKPPTEASSIFGGNTSGTTDASFKTPFGSPSAFGAPTSAAGGFGSATRSGGGGMFGSFGTAVVSASPGSGFGSSPFASAAEQSSVFGAAPVFGSASPFAATSTSPFGGGATHTIPTTTSTSGSMFGGGLASGGFSAFASKSSAFGQLAQKQQQQESPSLFGGGMKTGGGSSGGGGTIFGGGGFGGGSPTATTGTQQKSSAFTTFRK